MIKEYLVMYLPTIGSTLLALIFGLITKALKDKVTQITASAECTKTNNMLTIESIRSDLKETENLWKKSLQEIKDLKEELRIATEAICQAKATNETLGKTISGQAVTIAEIDALLRRKEGDSQ